MKPVILKEPFDLSKVIELGQEYIETLENGDYFEDSDNEHMLGEAIMQALYGPDIYDWINDKT